MGLLRRPLSIRAGLVLQLALVVVMQDIFVYEKQGLDPEGKVVGQYRATGVRPKFLDTIHTAGIHLGTDIFANRKA